MICQYVDPNSKSRFSPCDTYEPDSTDTQGLTNTYIDTDPPRAEWQSIYNLHRFKRTKSSFGKELAAGHGRLARPRDAAEALDI